MVSCYFAKIYLTEHVYCHLCYFEIEGFKLNSADKTQIEFFTLSFIQCCNKDVINYSVASVS